VGGSHKGVPVVSRTARGNRRPRAGHRRPRAPVLKRFENGERASAYTQPDLVSSVPLVAVAATLATHASPAPPTPPTPSPSGMPTCFVATAPSVSFATAAPPFSTAAASPLASPPRPGAAALIHLVVAVAEQGRGCCTVVVTGGSGRHDG